MSKRKSYMDRSSLLNEGVFEKILDFFKFGKTAKLKKIFNDPKLSRQVDKVQKSHKDLQKMYKSKYGIDLPDLDI